MTDQVLPKSPEYSTSAESSPSYSIAYEECDDSSFNFCLNTQTKQTARKSTNKMLTKLIEMREDESINYKIRSKVKQTARKQTSPYFCPKIKNKMKHQIITEIDEFYANKNNKQILTKQTARKKSVQNLLASFPKI